MYKKNFIHTNLFKEVSRSARLGKQDGVTVLCFQFCECLLQIILKKKFIKFIKLYILTNSNINIHIVV